MVPLKEIIKRTVELHLASLLLKESQNAEYGMRLAGLEGIAENGKSKILSCHINILDVKSIVIIKHGCKCNHFFSKTKNIHPLRTISILPPLRTTK